MKFINIKDSVEYTSKSESTLRRLIKDIQKSSNNKNDLVKKIKFEHAEKGGKKILLSVDFLDDYFNLKRKSFAQSENHTMSNEHSEMTESIDFITFLKSQILKKDEQIDSLTCQVNELIERQKESNILLLESKSIKRIDEDQPKRKWWQRSV